MTPAEVMMALELAMKAQQAIGEFLTKGLPVLQKAGMVIAHMQETGMEIPSIEDRAELKKVGEEVDAAAEAAIASHGG